MAGKEKMRVTAEKLNVRAEPKNTGAIIGTLEKDEIVDFEATSGDLGWHRIIRADGLRGWASQKFLVSLKHESEIPDSRFPWLPIAFRELGVKEFPGNANNPRVLTYLRTCESLPIGMQSQDQTDWCSAFVNYCVEQAGFAGTNSARARSWADWGKSIDKPEVGCIVVFWRKDPDGPFGHVGFFLSETEDEIMVLGGNQSNAVTKAPTSKDEFLGYRIAG